MAFEALNHAGHLDDNILVILNDNNMSISNNVGGLSSYFARMWASRPYNFIRTGGKRVLAKIPPALKAAHRAIRYDGDNRSNFSPPPSLGEHTDSVLAQFGFEQERIDALRAAGII